MLKRKLNLSLVAGGLAVGAVVGLSSVNIQAATSNTVINGNISSLISITSVSPQTINVSPTSGAATSSVSDTVTVNTNNATGYTLDLAMVGTATANDLIHTVTPANVINATSGSQTTPAALGANTWGYRVDDVGGFGAGTTTAETNVATSAFTWAAVPLGTANNLRSTTGPATNAQTNVWYAIHANNSLPSGTYTNTVTYTAVAKA